MARRHTTFRRGPRRETVWVGVTEVNTTLASSNLVAFISSLNATLLAARPFTIIRSRGILAFRSDQTGASESFNAALGYAVVSDQASAIGATAIPTPYTDLGSDLFFVHQFMSGRFEFVTGIGFHPQAMQTIEYDSKAMRKLNDDQDLAVGLETGGIGSGINIYHAGRILIKVH